MSATLRKLTIDDLEVIIPLIQQLNPNLSSEAIKSRQIEMFQIATYHGFCLFEEDRLIGVCSGWLTIRIYSGKQLEIDNVIIDSTIQSKGYGKQFMQLLEDWATDNDCKTIELNTYLKNSRSHKFYFNQGYQILGFHFQKEL